MLLNGINHVATLTADTDRLRAKDLRSFEAIRDRLMQRGAADDFVTDFGEELSLFFRDPDGLEGEVLVANPDAVPGAHNAPGTPAVRYVKTG